MRQLTADYVGGIKTAASAETEGGAGSARAADVMKSNNNKMHVREYKTEPVVISF